MKRVAIVGAGISGLLCARQLAGVMDVRVFEKSRHISGRMACRIVPETGAVFDHGAQYFTIRSERLRPMLEDWLDDRVVAPWRGSVVILRPGLKVDHDPTERFVGVPNMTSLARHLARPLPIRAEMEVTAATREADGWSLKINDQQSLGPFDWLVCATTPSPTDTILGASNPFQDQVQASTLNPCWATMVHFAEPYDVPFDGAFVHESPLGWICRNNSKPGRDVDRECWVLHATGDWSKEHANLSTEQAAAEALEALPAATGKPLPQVRFVISRRWPQSAPANPLGQSYLCAPEKQLGICGDWCAESRVEGAMLSGLEMADRILAELGE